MGGDGQVLLERRGLVRARGQRRLRLAYGVGEAEVWDFVDGSPCLKDFLARYHKKTAYEYGRVVCMFFKWLGIRGLQFTPEQLLDKQRRMRRSLKTETRRWGLRLVLAFSRDNPDFAGRSDGYLYLLYIVLKQFFEYNEAELHSGARLFKKRKRKYHPKQISMETAKKVLGCMPQRERTILIIMVQSGMGIGDVLEKFNFQKDYVQKCFEAGAERIRIDFDERKGNGFPYFTFISRDGIHELKKWFAIRRKWLDAAGCTLKNPTRDPIFITRKGGLYTIPNFINLYLYHLRRAKLKEGPYSVTSHMFRKLFKTETRPPERGIDQDCVEFMMGHISGIAAVGGIYDKTPEIYADVVEREYEKLEPYVNIYTGRPARTLVLTDEEISSLKKMAKMLSEGKLISLP